MSTHIRPRQQREPAMRCGPHNRSHVEDVGTRHPAAPRPDTGKPGIEPWNSRKKPSATEATRAFLDSVMAEPTNWRIQAFCDVENTASARVLEKIGLTFEGTLRRYMVLPNLGEVPRDVHCYAKVKT